MQISWLNCPYLLLAIINYVSVHVTRIVIWDIRLVNYAGFTLPLIKTIVDLI